AKEGWQVTQAVNGRMALDLAAESRPALILLDLMMPEMDGFEFLRELRRAETGRAVPGGVVTGKNLTRGGRRGVDGSVEMTLQKGSCTRDELLREIRDLTAACLGPARGPEEQGAAHA